MGKTISEKKPSFYYRLSSLIVIQVVFVFVAIALVLFNLRLEVDSDAALGGVRDRVTAVGARVGVISLVQGEDPDDLQLEAVNRYLKEQTWLHSVAVYRVDTSRSGISTKMGWCYHDGRVTTEDRMSMCDEGPPIDSRLIEFVAAGPDGNRTSAMPTADFSTYYCNLGSSGPYREVLVAVANHGLFISDLSSLKYIFSLLFLVSTLVSLLTVYLIRLRIRRPLQRLLHGLEKTAEGEMFYSIETSSDQELDKLVSAFNHMTQRLWSNHQELQTYNTRLNQMNKNLLESQLFLSTLIDNSPTAIITTSPDGQILIFNRMASEMFGCASERALGRSIGDFFSNPPGSRPGDSIPDDGHHGFEVRCCREDGESFPAYVVASPIASPNDGPGAQLYIIRDISESRSFQDMMIRLDRYYMRGQMAGDIAHEINNYLAILGGNVDLLPIILRKGDQEKIEKKLQLMRETVDRISRFADGLMDVPQDKAQFESLDLNQVVENILAFLKPQNRFDRVAFKTSLSSELPLVDFDAAQIQQLLVNFVFNAADALSETEGEHVVRVRTMVVETDGTRHARLEVIDNGAGVPEDKCELLFDQRFTTKRKGHGIGLITCRKIAHTHGGEVGYDSEKGSCFYFQLPIVSRVRQESEQETEQAATVG